MPPSPCASSASAWATTSPASPSRCASVRPLARAPPMRRAARSSTACSAGALVQATTTVDGETLTSQEFAVPAKGGVRVALIAGIQKAAAAEQAAAAAGAREPARPGVVEFGPESRIILEFQDDNLTLFYLLEVVNNARTPIDIGGPLILELPTGASGAVMLEGSSPQASVLAARVTITGPFPPGKLSAQVGFSLPNAGVGSGAAAEMAGGPGAGVRRRGKNRADADVVAAAGRHSRDADRGRCVPDGHRRPDRAGRHADRQPDGHAGREPHGPQRRARDRDPDPRRRCVDGVDAGLGAGPRKTAGSPASASA